MAQGLLREVQAAEEGLEAGVGASGKEFLRFQVLLEVAAVHCLPHGSLRLLYANQRADGPQTHDQNDNRYHLSPKHFYLLASQSFQ